jgi:putative ABC transport system permease protein
MTRGHDGGRWWRRMVQLPASRENAAIDVGREIRHHLDLCVAELVASGLSPDDARVEALRRFGDPERTAAECRTIEGDRQERVRQRIWLASVGQDVRFAMRTLRRSPGFTATAVLTLGLGIGMTTAMFSVVDAVLLRPLPLPQAERVVSLTPRIAGVERRGSPGLLAAWSEGSRSLASVAATAPRHATILAGNAAERIAGVAVTATYFDVVAVRPVLGRTLGRADDVPGAPPVIVLSHGLWMRVFGGDSAIVGRLVSFDGTLRTVIGIMPAALGDALGAADFWMPLALAPSQRDNFTPYLTLLGRLAPGATVASSARELDVITKRLGPRAAENGVHPAVSISALHRSLASAYARPLGFMLGAVALVLLIGCANVAILVLVRNVGRRRELAVRASLGAGQGRLVRQLVVEHVCLGLLAATAGMVFAIFISRMIVSMIPVEIPRLAGATVDARALAVAGGLGLLTSLLCGIAPMTHRRHLAIRALLQGGTRGSSDRGGERWRQSLIAIEVAMVVVLVAGAGLLIRSAIALGRVDPGFEVGRVLTARLALPQRDYPQIAAVVRAYEAIIAAAGRERGIDGVAVVSRVPLGGSATSVDVALATEAFTPATAVNAALRITSPGYFRTIGIPLLSGRDLTTADDARSARVVVVNASLARRLGGGGAVIGRRIHSDNAAFAVNGRPIEMEIVGVVGDVLDGGPRTAADPEFFAPLGQVSDEPWNYWIGREMLLVARGADDPVALAAALRRAVASVDASVPLYDVRTTGERVGRALAVERFSTRLVTILGVLGLGLAALGIHGVVAYSVTQRTREIGVRLALGCTASDAIGLVMRQAARPIGIGLVTGMGIAGLIASASAGLLFGVSPLDPGSLLGAGGLLGFVASLACYGPARRVAAVHPASALRSE